MSVDGDDNDSIPGLVRQRPKRAVPPGLTPEFSLMGALTNHSERSHGWSTPTHIGIQLSGSFRRGLRGVRAPGPFPSR
jgi:hypothetical protein